MASEALCINWTELKSNVQLNIVLTLCVTLSLSVQVDPSDGGSAVRRQLRHALCSDEGETCAEFGNTLIMPSAPPLSSRGWHQATDELPLYLHIFVLFLVPLLSNRQDTSATFLSECLLKASHSRDHTRVSLFKLCVWFTKSVCIQAFGSEPLVWRVPSSLRSKAQAFSSCSSLISHSAEKKKTCRFVR